MLWISLATACAATRQYYVAMNGNDGWTGRLTAPAADGTDGPFATVQRARDAIREYRSRHPDPDGFVVSIRGGVHRLTATLVFTPDDSGTADCPITYEAYEDERPVLSGGRTIADWHRGVDKRQHLWSVHLPDVANGQLYFNQLFVSGTRRPRARTYLRTAGRSRSLPEPRRSMRFNDEDFAKWDNLDDVLVRPFSSWIADLHWIKDVDQEKGVVTFTNTGWTSGRFDEHQRYTVENYFEALDSPGEWFLSRDGTLYYWPLDNEEMNKVIVTVPVVRERLIEFAGDAANDRFVEHITLKGISVHHLDWTTERARRYDHQDYSTVKWAGIYARGLRYSRIENCEVANLGTHGIYLEQGCKHNLIVQCHIHNVGGGGIYLSSRHNSAKKWDAVEHNTVDNNFIHDLGHVFSGAVGVWLGRGTHNVISHNEISDNDWSGISIGWPGTPHSAGNIVEHNHIHHVLRGVLGDGAGIYTLGVSPGSIIRNNLIHHVYEYPGASPGRGIYHDTKSADYTCENNVIYRVSANGVLCCGEAERITIRNNVFAFCGKGGIRSPSLSGTIERNLIYNRADTAALEGKWGKKGCTVDSNLYWTADGEPRSLRFGGKEFAAWQEAGNDEHSLIADPLFVDAERYDFRLREASPAYALGFKAVDMTSVGLYGETEWMALPKQMHRDTSAESPFPPCPSPGIDDGFEASQVGSLPDCFNSICEQKGGTIRVSDDTAAAGSKSLKFTDAPGLSASFYPYLFDDRYEYHAGTVEFSFDIQNSVTSPGQASILFRDYYTPRYASTNKGAAAYSYVEGPVIRLGKDGTLIANGKPMTRLPLGKWAHIVISFDLGKGKAKQYALKVAVAGQDKTTTAESLPFASNRFSVLTNILVLASMDPPDTTTVFYLDNPKLVRQSGQ